MPVLARMLPSPLTLEVRSGAVAALPELLADQRISAGGHVAVAVGPGQGEKVLRTLAGNFTNGSVHRVEGGTVQAARDLAESIAAGSYDAVLGIGGGRTLDVAKYAASLAGLPAISVATSLAHDGVASPVASLEHAGHKRSYGVQMPLAVVVDLDYVRSSPLRLLRAGIGDALSNLGAVADWELGAHTRGETVDGVAAALARSGAESVLHRTDELLDEDFLTTLAHAFALSGLAMAAGGSSRPGRRRRRRPPLRRRLPRARARDRRPLRRRPPARRGRRRRCPVHLVPARGSGARGPRRLPATLRRPAPARAHRADLRAVRGGGRPRPGHPPRSLHRARAPPARRARDPRPSR